MTKEIAIIVDDDHAQARKVINELHPILEDGTKTVVFMEVDPTGQLIVPKQKGYNSLDSDNFSEALVEAIQKESFDTMRIFIDLALTEDEKDRARSEQNYDGQFAPLVASTVLQSMANNWDWSLGEPKVYVYTTVTQLSHAPHRVRERLHYWVNFTESPGPNQIAVRWFPFDSLQTGVIDPEEWKPYLDSPKVLFWVKKDETVSPIVASTELVNA
jgi:hypothetical protein